MVLLVLSLLNLLFVGEELVYLDPHTTQLAVDFSNRDANDESFHCLHSSRMKILDLDPSIALVSWDCCRPFEPTHEILALFVLRKFILQIRMRSHSVRLDVRFLV